jgi:isopentenyl-diphosphate delta-isomerase
MQEIIDLVNEKDEVIGQESKNICHEKGLWHRAVAIFVFNQQGELLVQKRAPNMPRPNLLGASASGHLQTGDSYEEGAKRELKEELDIDCDIKPIGKFKMDVSYPDGKIDKEHYAIFTCHYDGKFTIQKEELSSVKFISIDKIEKMMHESPSQFTPGFQREFQHYLDSIKN